MELKKEVTVTLNHEDLVCLLSSARYGIPYWCDCIDYSEKAKEAALNKCLESMNKSQVCQEDIWAEILLLGYKLRLYDSEGSCADDPNSTYYKLTLDKLQNGVAQLISNGEWDGKDWGDFDSALGDVAIQYALFNELVFS